MTPSPRRRPARTAAGSDSGAPLSPDAAEAKRIQRLIESPSYALAFEDHDFVMSHDQRPMRLQLELQKPETILRQHKIRYTIVVFGGTRIIEPKVARARVAALEAEIRDDGDDPVRRRRLAIAQRVVAKAKYYDAAREF